MLSIGDLGPRLEIQFVEIRDKFEDLFMSPIRALR